MGPIKMQESVFFLHVLGIYFQVLFLVQLFQSAQEYPQRQMIDRIIEIVNLKQNEKILQNCGGNNRNILQT